MAWLSWHNLLVLSGAICVSGRPVVCWYAYHILTLAGNNQSHVDVQFSRCWFVSLEFSLSILLFCGPLLDFLPTIFLFFRTWPRSWPRPVTQLLLKVFFLAFVVFRVFFHLRRFIRGKKNRYKKLFTRDLWRGICAYVAMQQRQQWVLFTWFQSTLARRHVRSANALKNSHTSGRGDIICLG